MTSPADQCDRWEPDDQLIAAVRCGNGSRTLADLSDPDRCWVVAGLTLAGMKGEDIADRLSCSIRSIRAIRAADMTSVCLLLQSETLHFGQQMALADSDARALRRDLNEVVADRDRLRGQLDRVLDARMMGQAVDVCGRRHLMTEWNTYWHNGRRWCRECHAERQRDYRLARKLGVSSRAVREARENGDLESFVQTVLAPGSTAR